MEIIEKKAYEVGGKLFHTIKEAENYYNKYIKDIKVGDFVSMKGHFSSNGMFSNGFEPQGYVIRIMPKIEGKVNPNDEIQFLSCKHGGLPKHLLFDKTVEKRLTRKGLQFHGKNVDERFKGYSYKVQMWAHPRKKLVRGTLESMLVTWK